MNELSIIIAFRNENTEIEQTISEIKRTVGGAVDIILVNDASEDNYDYKAVAYKYNTTYVENSERQGCAASREIGIMASQTPYIFIIDGHMRFYDSNWHRIIIDAVKNNPRSIYCCKCQSWNYETKKESKAKPGYGAYFDSYGPKKHHIIEVRWISKDICPEKDTVEIPCVLGACYAASKDYWNYLLGLRGLKLYSCDEAYVSIKAWMEGGGCRLLKNLTVGHLFRNQAPYKISENEFHYNKYFISETIFPEAIKEKINSVFLQNLGFVDYSRLKRQINREDIESYKRYYASNFTFGFENFEKINNQIKEKLDIPIYY